MKGSPVRVRASALRDLQALNALAVLVRAGELTDGRSCPSASSAVDLDPAAPEGVDATPPARDVEELQPADRRGERGVDDEMLALWLEPEHRPQEEERRSVDHACGLQAVGYWTGYFVAERS